jgi:hypothetical protein
MMSGCLQHLINVYKFIKANIGSKGYFCRLSWGQYIKLSIPKVRTCKHFEVSKDEYMRIMTVIDRSDQEILVREYLRVMFIEG